MKDSHKRNNCWRVKKCFVFFEEDSSEEEEIDSIEEEADSASGEEVQESQVITS
jgi:hypothetical protein